MLSLLMVLIGLLTGLTSGLLGIGGGVILVPLLIMVGIPTKIAIGSSLAYIALTGISGFAMHRHQGNYNLMLALTAIIGGVLTVQLGAQMTVYMKTGLLEMLLGLLLLGVSFAFFYSRKRLVTRYAPSKTLTHLGTHRPRLKIYKLSLAIGIMLGFLTGMFGVGGGFLFVPLMVMAFGISIRIAIGTSLLFVVSIAISGVIRHWMLGQIDLLLVFVLAIGGIIGAPLGAMVTQKLSSRILTNIFIAVLFVLGIKLLICY